MRTAAAERCRNIFGVSTLSGLGLDDYSMWNRCRRRSYAVSDGDAEEFLWIIFELIKPYAANQFMLLDRATRRNLELCETMREKAEARIFVLGIG